MNPPTSIVPTVVGCNEVELPYTPPTDELERELLATQVGANYTGTSTVINVIPGKGYYWVNGANETSITYVVSGDPTPIVDTGTTQYFIPATGTVTIIHTNNAAVTGTLHELRVQTYRLFREGVVVEDKTGTKQEFTDITVSENTLARYAIEAIAANGDKGKSAIVTAVTPRCSGTAFPMFWGIEPGRTDAFGIKVDSSSNIVVGYSVSGGFGLVKFDSNGLPLWHRYFANQNYPQIHLKANGDVVIAGVFSGTINLGGSTLVASNQHNVYVAGYSGTNGSHQFSFRKLPGAGSTIPGVNENSIRDYVLTALTVDDSGGDIYIAGGAKDAAGFFVLPDALAWLDRYTTGGTQVWHKERPRDPAYNGIYGLAISGNDLWCAGDAASAISEDLGCGPVQSADPISGSRDLVVFRLNKADKTCLTHFVHGGVYPQSATGLALDSDGLIVTINYQGASSVGGANLSTGSGYGSGAIAKYSFAGAHLWSTDLGGSSQHRVSNPVIFGNHVYFSGYIAPQAVWGGVSYSRIAFSATAGFVAQANKNTGAHGFFHVAAAIGLTADVKGGFISYAGGSADGTKMLINRIAV